MRIEALQNFLEQPIVHRTALAGYEGAYSLGIGQEPGSSELVLILHVAGAPTANFPKTLRLGSEDVPLIVHPDFTAPVPLAK